MPLWRAARPDSGSSEKPEKSVVRRSSERIVCPE